MEEAARAEPRVLGAPNDPASFLVRFGENGIDLELGVWIKDPENGQLNLRSALNKAILRSFRANGIRIPFPQREVRHFGLPAVMEIAAPGSERAGPAG
jgi:small-conductance mechanosensitive channel